MVSVTARSLDAGGLGVPYEAQPQPTNSHVAPKQRKNERTIMIMDAPLHFPVDLCFFSHLPRIHVSSPFNKQHDLPEIRCE